MASPRVLRPNLTDLNDPSKLWDDHERDYVKGVRGSISDDQLIDDIHQFRMLKKTETPGMTTQTSNELTELQELEELARLEAQAHGTGRIRKTRTVNPQAGSGIK